MPRKRHIESEPELGAPVANDQAAAKNETLTVSELAARWRCNRHTVMAAIRAGRLQAFKVGERTYRIRHDEVVRYEHEHMAVAS